MASAVHARDDGQTQKLRDMGWELPLGVNFNSPDQRLIDALAALDGEGRLEVFSSTTLANTDVIIFIIRSMDELVADKPQGLLKLFVDAIVARGYSNDVPVQANAVRDANGRTVGSIFYALDHAPADVDCLSLTVVYILDLWTDIGFVQELGGEASFVALQSAACLTED